MDLPTTIKVVVYPALALAVMLGSLGWLSLSGVFRRGWVHTYRESGATVGQRNLAWISAYGGGAAVLLLVALDAVVVGIYVGAAVLGAIGVVLGSIALWLRHHPVPGWLKPAWLRRMEADDWAGYWGDAADRRAGRRLAYAWLGIGGVASVASLVAMLTTSSDLLVWGAIAMSVGTGIPRFAALIKR